MSRRPANLSLTRRPKGAMVPPLPATIRSSLRHAARARQLVTVATATGAPISGTVESTGRFTRISNAAPGGPPPAIWTVRTSAILAVASTDDAVVETRRQADDLSSMDLAAKLAVLENRVANASPPAEQYVPLPVSGE